MKTEKKFYCDNCGVEIPEDEYESNSGYCDACAEEEFL